MAKKIKTSLSTRIDLNKDKVYRITDIDDFAWLVFPNKNAADLRAGFILIFLAVKYSTERRVSSAQLDKIREDKAPEISQKTLWKARAVMARLGFISRQEMVWWKFSSAFSKSLHNLAAKTDQLIVPNSDPDKKHKEWCLLEYAKAYCNAQQTKPC